MVKTQPKVLRRGVAAMLVLSLMSWAAYGVPSGTYSSITSNFNGTSIDAGHYIWFNSVLNPNGLGATPVTIYMHDSNISYTANNLIYNLSVADTQVTFSPTATIATATFDSATNSWHIIAPISGLAGNTFLAGATQALPNGLPGGADNITWSGYFEASASGIGLSWKWAAAAYNPFSSDYNALGVKPVDDQSASSYQNSHHAGTPENFLQGVEGGARGGGGSNWTGSYSGTATLQLPNVPMIPEPATLALCALGSLLLGVAAKRRRRV